MMHFKNNRSGFTLVEVMVAVLIVGFALTPIIAQQIGLTRRVGDASRLFDYWLKARQFFMDSRQEETDKLDLQREKNLEGARPLSLKYERRKVSQQSSLKKVKNLYRHTVLYREKSATKPAGMLVAFTVEAEKKAS